jgi:hypothetical protein
MRWWWQWQCWLFLNVFSVCVYIFSCVISPSLFSLCSVKTNKKHYYKLERNWMFIIYNIRLYMILWFWYEMKKNIMKILENWIFNFPQGIVDVERRMRKWKSRLKWRQITRWFNRCYRFFLQSYQSPISSLLLCNVSI